MTLGATGRDRPITSTVTAVLIPIDRFTRRRIQSGIEAAVIDAEGRVLPYRMIRNGSGYLVLTDLPSDSGYTVRLDPGEAGYLGPIDVTINPAVDGIDTVVRLEAEPSFPFEPGTTLVRGTIITVEGPVVGASITVVGDRYRTTSADRGAFALPLQLPPPAAGEPPGPLDVELQIERADLGSRLLSVTLFDGRTHVFTEPIELDGVNQPPFADPSS